MKSAADVPEVRTSTENWSKVVLLYIDKKSELNYAYTARTSHWLLNKQVAVSRVFDGVVKGINSLFKNIAGQTGIKISNPKTAQN